MEKSGRLGMRISPEKKEKWETTADQWGYKSLSAFITAMTDWAIAFDEFNGDYKAYQDAVKNGQVNG